MTYLLTGLEWLVLLVFAPIVIVCLVTMVVVFTIVGFALLFVLAVAGILLWLKELYCDWRYL